MAPGGSIISTVDTGKTVPASNSMFSILSGTSQSTPHVAGVIALMFEANPGATVDELKSALTSTATSMAAQCPEGCGAGLINARKAVESILAIKRS